jgi:hypothetical protein
MHRRLSVSSACDLGSASARDTVALREQQSVESFTVVAGKKRTAPGGRDNGCFIYEYI